MPFLPKSTISIEDEPISFTSDTLPMPNFEWKTLSPGLNEILFILDELLLIIASASFCFCFFSIDNFLIGLFSRRFFTLSSSWVVFLLITNEVLCDAGFGAMKFLPNEVIYLRQKLPRKVI